MANHVPTGAASGALRGGMLGAVLGFLAIPALVATGFGAAAALGYVGSAVTTAGISWGAVAGISAIAGIATTIVNTFIPTPLNNLAMAAYGAAGFGLFGAAGGAEKGMQQNVQEQARSAYINAYAQTRAGIDQMAMQAYAAPEMQTNVDAYPFQTGGASYVAANENNAPTLKISADSAEHHGKQAQLAVANERG